MHMQTCIWIFLEYDDTPSLRTALEDPLWTKGITMDEAMDEGPIRWVCTLIFL